MKYCRYVLDGFPVTRRQVDLMTQRHIIPVRVIELQLANKREVVLRGVRDRMQKDKRFSFFYIL